MEVVGYEKSLRLYCAALDWFEKETQIRIRGRLLDYRHTLEQVIAKYSDGSIHDEGNAQLRGNFIRIIPEAFSIIQIYEYFEGHPRPWLRSKLIELLSGPTLAEQERSDTSNIRARNLLFEVLIGTYLVRAGGTPAQETTNESDGVFEYAEDYALIVECKRIHSASKTTTNLKKAKKQLTERLKMWRGAKTPLGLICVDLTKLVNKGDKVLEVQTPDESRKRLAGQIDVLLPRHNFWPTYFSNRSVLGAIFYISAPVATRAPARLNHAQELLFLSNGNSFFSHIAARIARRLETHPRANW